LRRTSQISPDPSLPKRGDGKLGMVGATCLTFLSERISYFREVRKKGDKDMLAKKTSKNQITIPKKIVDELPEVTYFDVEWKGGVIVLKPVRLYSTDLEQIRAKVKKLGISESSVDEAIKWARAK
jgi:hypothetical protein